MKTKNLLFLGGILCIVLVSMIPASRPMAVTAGGTDKTIDDIKYKDIRNFGPIIKNEIVNGYYLFSKGSKTGGGNAAFRIEILDMSLKTQKTIKLDRPKASELVEMSYNGSNFFLMMTNKKGVDMLTYNMDGKKTGEMNFEKVSKWERMRIDQAMASEEGSNASVYPLGESGFVRQSMVKNKKLGYSVEAYSNNLKEFWTYQSKPDASQIEVADIMYSSENYVALLKSKKKNLMSKDIDNDFILLDARDGKAVFELPMKEISDLSVLGCYVDEENKQVILNGEYFGKGKNISNSKSEGLYLMKLDMNGEQLKMEKLSWKNELKDLTAKDDEKGKTSDNMRFYIHKVFIGANGNTYVVAEQYKKVVSASAVAMKMMAAAAGGTSNSNVSNVSIKMYNMVYMVFDKEFQLVESELVKKKYSEAHLPKGMEYSSATMLAAWLKANGAFDYQFSTTNPEKTAFTSYYFDLNRKGTDGSKNDAVVGTIALVNGKMETKRTPVNTNYSSLFIYPADEGNLLIGEYWRKKKKLMMRIEAMN